MAPRSLPPWLEGRRDEIKATVRRHRGRDVSVFGSVARGDDSPESDVDLLVDFEPDSSLFDLLHLTQELQALLGRPVDVVSRGGLKPRDTRVVEEAVPL